MRLASRSSYEHITRQSTSNSEGFPALVPASPPACGAVWVSESGGVHLWGAFRVERTKLCVPYPHLWRRKHSKRRVSEAVVYSFMFSVSAAALRLTHWYICGHETVCFKARMPVMPPLTPAYWNRRYMRRQSSAPSPVGRSLSLSSPTRARPRYVRHHHSLSYHALDLWAWAEGRRVAKWAGSDESISSAPCARLCGAAFTMHASWP